MVDGPHCHGCIELWSNKVVLELSNLLSDPEETFEGGEGQEARGMARRQRGWVDVQVDKKYLLYVRTVLNMQSTLLTHVRTVFVYGAWGTTNQGGGS